VENGKNMKMPEEQTLPENKKRDYVKPEIKKCEQVKEVTEGFFVTVTSEPE
jgi:hypothetical protein